MNNEQKTKGTKPDFELITFHEGETYALGAMWSNKDQPGKKAAIQFDLTEIPPELFKTKFRAYLCEKQKRQSGDQK